jgi:hypothetical protein
MEFVYEVKKEFHWIFNVNYKLPEEGCYRQLYFVTVQRSSIFRILGSASYFMVVSLMLRGVT